MNALKPLRWWGLAVALMVALAGCGGPGSATGGSGGNAAGFDFTLSSYARTGTTSTTASATPQAVSLTSTQPTAVQVNGQLLVHSIDKNTDEVYNWALTVDELSFRINTAVTLNLDSGRYDFYFLLNSGSHYYAGIAQNQLILNVDGQTSNTIAFTLNPVISDQPVDVRTIQQLAQFRFKYDFTEIKAYGDPAFSIKVDDGAENLFNINANAEQPFVYVLLPQGTYHFLIKFYDGSTLKLVADQNVEIGGSGGTTDLNPQPLVTEVSYAYTPGSTPAQDSGNVTFVVPNSIVDEAGGLGTLQASAAVVGPLTSLVEGALTLGPSSGSSTAYEGTLAVPGFTSGPITWSVQFRDTRDGQLFAYCAQTVTIPTPTGTGTLTGTFACVPQMIAREVTTAQPVSPLTVNVRDPDGPVPGAVVSANDEPIGITSGGGLVELPGQLLSFLPGGSYVVKAEQDLLDPLGSGNIISRSAQVVAGLTPGQPRELNLDLAGIQAPPPPPPPGDDQQGEDGGDGNTPAQDYIVVTAQRQNSPLRFLDGEVELSGWAKIRIPSPEDISVTQGDANQFMLLLSFGRRQLKCWYLGGQRSEEMAGWLDDFVRNTFSNPVCTKGQSAGDTFWVRGPVHARVIVANRSVRLTEVTVQIPVVAVGQPPEGHAYDQRPNTWHGRGYWHWWGWWLGSGDWHGGDHDDNPGQGSDHGNGHNQD
ncbi:MAG TPA: carboxypeptidase-like regulatory domain-containing protein [bacterium]|nr:carboxypeptidase-like regulatory domain-containing protein [bacterium]